jgi:L-alanine-DL-glutamate epimerase-like enolase superfamily enzyme
MSRIISVDPIPVKIPPESNLVSDIDEKLPQSNYHRKPHRGLVYSMYRESVFIKISTDDGKVGWGETLASVVPEVAAKIIKTLMEPQLVGQDPMAGDFLWTQMYNSMRDRGHFTGFFSDALAGCDTALWDLRGKALGVPVFSLLGGPYRKKIRIYASGVKGSSPDERAASAMSFVAQGFDAIKLHLTSGREDTLNTVKAVREAVGPSILIMVDAHNIYDIAESIRVGHEMEKLGVYFFEAPTNPEDIRGFAEIAAALEMRVAAGEGERSRFQFRDRLVARAIDVVQPDLGYVGLSEMRRIAMLADTFHVPMAPHLSAGLGICIAATLQLAASIPNFLIQEFNPASFDLGNQLLNTPLVRDGGYLLLPMGPGLGVEPIETLIRQYEVKL